MNLLIDFRVCTLAGCIIFYNFKLLLSKDVLSNFWVFKLMLHSKGPIIRRKTKMK